MVITGVVRSNRVDAIYLNDRNYSPKNHQNQALTTRAAKVHRRGRRFGVVLGVAENNSPWLK